MKVKRFAGGLCVSNSYVVSSEKTRLAVLVDCCGENDKILNYLEKNSLTLKAICLTHGHFDHISGLAELREKTAADVCIFESENRFLSDAELNLSNTDGVYAGEKRLKTADILLMDGAELGFGDIHIDVIHTPGHTSGSVCYKMENYLFSGDTLFHQSVGRADFPTGDFAEEISSIRRKLFTLDNDIIVYPGHGFSTSIGSEKRDNPYL